MAMGTLMGIAFHERAAVGRSNRTQIADSRCLGHRYSGKNAAYLKRVIAIRKLCKDNRIMGKFNKSSPAPPMGTPMMMPVAQPQTAPVQNNVAKLKELKELLDSGVLTQEEFDARKKIILAEPFMPMQPVMPVEPVMPYQARPPPPGCPPGGEYVMVKYCGPESRDTASPEYVLPDRHLFHRCFRCRHHMLPHLGLRPGGS
jgi:hypothetical protein